jgi:hypothetical protein
MSQRSVRRQAELAVLEAAQTIRSACIYPTTPSVEVVDVRLEWGDLDRLNQAVDALNVLGLAEPSQTRTSKIAPVTSHLAAAYMHGNRAKGQAAWILRRLLLNPSGFTTDELVQISQKPHQSISARVNELRDGGWIRDSGRTAKTRSNQPATIWVLTQQARYELSSENGLL